MNLISVRAEPVKTMFLFITTNYSFRFAFECIEKIHRRIVYNLSHMYFYCFVLQNINNLFSPLTVRQ